MGSLPQAGETPKERADRELVELLNELRVVLPGITVLFGFLLAVPFAGSWKRVNGFQQDVFLAAFLATGVSILFLVALTSYHRLRFREADKEHLVRLGNVLGILGIGSFGFALAAVVLLVTDVVAGSAFASAAAAGAAALVVGLWFGLPAWDRMRGR
jgi:O-antigen/teichoic acid export membrane protein